MSAPLDHDTRRAVERIVDALSAEFATDFDRAQVEEVVDDSVRRLLATARVYDFLPLMVSRFSRERLRALRRATEHDRRVAVERERAGDWAVVYVSLSGGGRGQIAAALTTRLSHGQVSVHAAGTAVRAEIDPGVRTVISEMGMDPADAFARPVTDDVLRGADVIVTMGHSVGLIELPQEVRREDWRVGDPIGAPIDEVRRVGADIEYRVRALLGELDVRAAAG